MGVYANFGMSYKKYPLEYPMIFETKKSAQAFEEVVSSSGFGLPVVMPEGQSVTYDDAKQGFVSRWTHIQYGLGFIITRNMMNDGIGIAKSLAKGTELGFSMRTGIETLGANVLNRAFTAAYAGGDGLELCSTLHVNKAGGTYANELSTAADLSETSLEQACIDIAGLTDDRGKQIAIKPLRLIVHRNDDFDAQRILRSELRVDTANNDINALRSMGTIPGGHYVNHFLTDTDAWFIITDCEHGMCHFEREKARMTIDNDFDTDNAKFKKYLPKFIRVGGSTWHLRQSRRIIRLFI